MEILFVSSFAVVAPDPVESRKLFIDALGLPLKRHEGDDYFFSEQIGGAKHFGVWPLSRPPRPASGPRPGRRIGPYPRPVSNSKSPTRPPSRVRPRSWRPRATRCCIPSAPSLGAK